MSAMRVSTVCSDCGVQPRRAVGQVVVVDQDELAARNTHQRRNIRARALDVELLAVHAHQLAAGASSS